MKIRNPAFDARAYLLRCRAALMMRPTPANLAKVAAFDTVLRYVEVGALKARVAVLEAALAAAGVDPNANRRRDRGGDHGAHQADHADRVDTTGRGDPARTR